jgi:HEAT repeat protein
MREHPESAASLLESPQVLVRTAIIGELVKHPDARLISPLERRLADQDGYIKQQAAFLLLRLKDPRLRQLIDAQVARAPEDQWLFDRVLKKLP